MITVTHSTFDAADLTEVSPDCSDFPPGTLFVPKKADEFRQVRELPDGAFEVTYNFVVRQGGE